MSSARSHIALPFLALVFDRAFSWSPALFASRRALSESLSAEAMPTSAAATTSATSGFWASAFNASPPLFLPDLPSFFCFFFLSLGTGPASVSRREWRSYHYPSHDCNDALFQSGFMWWIKRLALFVAAR